MEKKKLILGVITLLAIIIDIITLNFGIGKSGFFCIRWLAFAISTNLFLKILTNQENKISKWGTVIICSSSAALTSMNFDIITFGEIALIFLNKLTDSSISKGEDESKLKKKKVLYAIGIWIALIAYLLTLNFSLQISFGYVFIALAIWIFIKNRKKYKITVKNIVVACIGLVGLVITCLLFNNLTNGLFVEATKQYNGAREGNGITYLFSYVYNFLMPYKNTGMNETFASMLSVFPVPVIIAMIYMYKKEKHEEFIFPMICVITLEIIWALAGLPSILAKGTGLYLVTIKDCTLGIALANIYLYLYLFANVDEEVINTTNSIRITLALLVVHFFVPRPDIYAEKWYSYIFAGILTLESFLMMNYTDKRYRKVSLGFIALLTIIGSVIIFV